MGRDEQFHAGSGSQVDSLPFVQVAHNVELLAEIAPAVDGQQRDVHFELGQALDQAVEGKRIASRVHPDPCHLYNVTKVAVKALTVLLDKTEVVDSGRRLEAMQGRDGKEFD